MRLPDFFHGTQRDVDSDTLLPANTHGVSNYPYSGWSASVVVPHEMRADPYESTYEEQAAREEELEANLPEGRNRGDFVYLGTTEKESWEWAQGGDQGRGRPRVYSAVPDRIGAPVERYGKEIITNQATITDTHWIPPNPKTYESYSQEIEDRNYDLGVRNNRDPNFQDPYHQGRVHGIQGTLPPVNWNQFRNRDTIDNPFGDFPVPDQRHGDFGNWKEIREPRPDTTPPAEKPKPVTDPRQMRLF